MSFCHNDKSDRELLFFIIEELGFLRAKIGDVMSGVDNLNLAVQKIADDLTAEQTVIQEVVDALKNAGTTGGLSDTDAQALADKLGGSASTIETITSTLQGAITPAPPADQPPTA